jgi:predicted dehydrogenase
MPFVTFEKPIDEEITHFVECVRGGKKPIIDARGGAMTVSVLDAAVKSYRTGLPKRLSKF